MKKTFEELRQEESKLNNRLIKVRKKIEAAKPVDGWYLAENKNWLGFLKDGWYKFGINGIGRWVNKFGDLDKGSFCDTDYLATPEEVTKRLTEFVNGLGYKEGVKAADVRNKQDYLIGSSPLEFIIKEYDSVKGGCILMGGVMIWSNQHGWAKIVPQKPKYTVVSMGNSLYSLLLDGKATYLGIETAKKIEDFLNQ